MAHLLLLSPARLDQSPLIWRGHENNCSRQTGRREIVVPEVTVNQLYLTSCDKGKNSLWSPVSVHDLEFVSGLLIMEKAWSVLITSTSFSSATYFDIKLLIRDPLVLMWAYMHVFFTGKPMSENPQGSISCTNGWSFKSTEIHSSRDWNLSLATQEVRSSAQMKNKPKRGKWAMLRRKRYRGHRVFKGQQRWTSSLCVRQYAAPCIESF